MCRSIGNLADTDAISRSSIDNAFYASSTARKLVVSVPI